MANETCSLLNFPAKKMADQNRVAEVLSTGMVDFYKRLNENLTRIIDEQEKRNEFLQLELAGVRRSFDRLEDYVAEQEDMVAALREVLEHLILFAGCREEIRDAMQIVNRNHAVEVAFSEVERSSSDESDMEM